MYIKVEVLAGAKRERVEKTGPDSFAVSVREKAEQNAANRRVLQIIRQQFGAAGVTVKIISGHRSPRKIISLDVNKNNLCNHNFVLLQTRRCGSI